MFEVRDAPAESFGADRGPVAFPAGAVALVAGLVTVSAGVIELFAEAVYPPVSNREPALRGLQRRLVHGQALLGVAEPPPRVVQFAAPLPRAPPLIGHWQSPVQGDLPSPAGRKAQRGRAQSAVASGAATAAPGDGAGAFLAARVGMTVTAGDQNRRSRLRRASGRQAART